MTRQVYDLLSIYDPSDWIGRWQGGHTGKGTYTVKAESVAELKAVLDGLLRDGKIFKRVVFTTHGDSGVLWFGDDPVYPSDLFNKFNDGRYERLFPFKETRMYFDGCNVAEGEDGWKFLEAAARTFLRQAGGHVFGWTSRGIGLPSWVPAVGGHTAHLWGKVRYVFIDPAADGGAYLRRYPTEADRPAPRVRQDGLLTGGMKF